MKSITSFVLKYLAIWIILSTCYFFSAETITKWITPGFGGVETWLTVLTLGLVLISAIITISFFVGLRRRKRNIKTS
jgi:hypothetical protein